MVHKKIINEALGRLDGERASYFSDVVNLLDDDPRTGEMPNMVYLVLKETMGVLPTYLPKKTLVELLFAFVNKNRLRLNRLIFSKRFIHDPSCVREATNGYVHMVSEEALEMYLNGEIDGGEKTVHRITWPYDESDFPYFDDDEPEFLS